MIKTENRAAAKSYQREKMQKHRDEVHAQGVAADLEELRRIRHYIMFGSKVRVPSEGLVEAIDDYVELLTGDRTKLHAPRHSIG